jgi:hypothetical protein
MTLELRCSRDLALRLDQTRSGGRSGGAGGDKSNEEIAGVAGHKRGRLK